QSERLTLSEKFMYTSPINQAIQVKIAGPEGLQVSVDLDNLLLCEYEMMTDENIVEAVRDGDSEALEFLILKYKNFVRAKARSYFLIGADREDIVQEGMIGLYKSIRDFRGDKLASFKAFAELCITRQII